MSDLSAVSTLSITEAASLSHVSTRTVRRWMARGHVVTVVQGRERRVSAGSLSEYLDRLGHAGQGPVDSGDRADTLDMGSTDTSDNADSVDTDTGDIVDNAGSRDIEAVHLAALVRELAVENRQLAATAAMWQERAGILGDRLAVAESRLAALMAPSDGPGASNLTPGVPDPTPGPSHGPAWHHANLSAAVTPWLVLVAILLLAFAVGWLR